MNEQFNDLLSRWQEIALNTCKLASGGLLEYKAHGERLSTSQFCYAAKQKLDKCMENEATQILLVALLKMHCENLLHCIRYKCPIF